MQIYDRPTKSLMHDWAKEHLTPGQVFNKASVGRWFEQSYPKIKRNTVMMHVEAMAVNNRSRRHHPNVRPGSDHDLFWKIGPDQFRLWDPENDPPPRYKDNFEKLATGDDAESGAEERVTETEEGEDELLGAREFAFERDLQNYLVRNLGLIEPGLRLYEDEGLTGVEFPVGGRRIDILAVDAAGDFVVIELKVSRGYDRVVGQLLRYMAWVRENMTSANEVRGVIVANEITDDLKLASSLIPNVRLIEYEINFSLKPV